VPVIGVLFFASLVIAGFTSLISVIEVVISGVRDKFEMSRRGATLAVTVPMAVLSLAFFSTTSGIYVLDILDHFINQFGILLVAVISMLVIAWGLRALPLLGAHLSEGSSVNVGAWWRVLVSVVAPLGLALVLVQAFWTDARTPYGDYPGWMLLVFGWGAAVAVLAFGFLAAQSRWRDEHALSHVHTNEKGAQS
jgi:neurotransmitter:Na+ symporter, NSS family